MQKFRTIGFFLKIGFTVSLNFGLYNLQYVPASKPFDQAWFEVLEPITVYCTWSDNRQYQGKLVFRILDKLTRKTKPIRIISIRKSKFYSSIKYSLTVLKEVLLSLWTLHNQLSPKEQKSWQARSTSSTQEDVQHHSTSRNKILNPLYNLIHWWK